MDVIPFRKHADVWIVVPAYNEQRRVGPVLDRLLRITPHVVVVDDRSRDETVSEALRRPVWLLRHRVNLGQGAALQTGIDFALEQGADYVITFDADGQHDPEDIPTLLEALRRDGADFALGSRFLGRAVGIPWTRRVVLRLGILFTRVLSGIRLSDVHNGIRALTRRGAQAVRITLNRMEHASEILDQIAASGLKFVEVPVTIRYSAESLEKGQKTQAAVGLGLRLIAERVLK